MGEGVGKALFLFSSLIHFPSNIPAQSPPQPLFVPKTKNRVLKHVYNCNILFLIVSILFLIMPVLGILKLRVFERRLLRRVSNGEESF